MSKTIKIDAQAPDFAMEDFRGALVSLADFHGNKNVLIVFNRGFS